MSIRRPILALVALSLLALPAAAPAAEPESGSVDASKPKAEWAGTLIRPYLYQNVFYYEDQAGETGAFPCQPPGCDTFTLDVKGGGADLTISVQSEQTTEMSLRIQNPAGEWQYFNGWADTAKATVAKYKKAPDGTYTVNVIARVFGSTNPTAVDDTADYKGTAALAVAPAAVTPPAVTPPSTSPPQTPADSSSEKSSSKSKKKKLAACKKKAKKIKKAKKRRAATKRCAKKHRG